jgi:hypothetical protein
MLILPEIAGARLKRENSKCCGIAWLMARIHATKAGQAAMLYLV